LAIFSKISRFTKSDPVGNLQQNIQIYKISSSWQSLAKYPDLQNQIQLPIFSKISRFTKSDPVANLQKNIQMYKIRSSWQSSEKYPDVQNLIKLPIFALLNHVANHQLFLDV
jgi:hypothetical protein